MLRLVAFCTGALVLGGCGPAVPSQLGGELGTQYHKAAAQGLIKEMAARDLAQEFKDDPVKASHSYFPTVDARRVRKVRVEAHGKVARIHGDQVELETGPQLPTVVLQSSSPLLPLQAPAARGSAAFVKSFDGKTILIQCDVTLLSDNDDD